MIFEDATTIQAPPLRVWEFLLDVDRLAACAPGVEEVTRVDDTTFAAVLTASVGPITGKFSFQARIVESVPPVQLVAVVEGTDSVTHSTLTSNVQMDLAEADQQATVLAYRANVMINGRLAILGDMVLRATASLLLEELFRRVRSELEGRPAEAPAP